jgi:hypothetical protein
MFLSCSLPTTKGFLEQNVNNKEVYNDYFSNRNIDYIYKAKLIILGNRFGGILIIKRIDKEQYRIVFTTEFGNKIFDLDYNEDKINVKYIVDELNKKRIINILQHDFQLLIKQNILAEKEFISKTHVIYRSKLSKSTNYYIYLQSNNELKKIVRASKTKEKFTVEYEKIEDQIAKKISLIHHDFDMRIDLTFIND